MPQRSILCSTRCGRPSRCFSARPNSVLTLIRRQGGARACQSAVSSWMTVYARVGEPARRAAGERQSWVLRQTIARAMSG